MFGGRVQEIKYDNTSRWNQISTIYSETTEKRYLQSATKNSDTGWHMIIINGTNASMKIHCLFLIVAMNTGRVFLTFYRIYIFCLLSTDDANIEKYNIKHKIVTIIRIIMDQYIDRYVDIKYNNQYGVCLCHVVRS